MVPTLLCIVTFSTHGEVGVGLKAPAWLERSASLHDPKAEWHMTSKFLANWKTNEFMKNLFSSQLMRLAPRPLLSASEESAFLHDPNDPHKQVTQMAKRSVGVVSWVVIGKESDWVWVFFFKSEMGMLHFPECFFWQILVLVVSFCCRFRSFFPGGVVMCFEGYKC